MPRIPVLPSPGAGVIIDCMNRVFGAFLCVLLLAACGLKENSPGKFVTGIVMPDESYEFAPGDEVTVTAEGFEPDDDIIFEINWPQSPASSIMAGYAKGVWGIVTARTGNSITFLAPGHYPASKTTVLLFRRGETMTLGTILVADGQLTGPALYGITEYDTDETAIDRIDWSDGGMSRVATLGVGRGLSCAVNAGMGWICGLYSGSAVGVDLSMGYFRDFGFGEYLVAGQVSDTYSAYLRCENGRLYLDASVTRTPSPVVLSWPFPEGVEPEMIVRQPFVHVEGILLLTVRKSDGSCAPLALSLRGDGGSKLGEFREADAMIPFWIVQASEDEPGKKYQAGGYAVSKENDTRLWLLDPASMTLGDLLATQDGTVLSVSQSMANDGRLNLCVLCDQKDGRYIWVYDKLTVLEASAYRIPARVDCSEIVVAK